ncbi:hypothetical protein KFK14_12810 [Sphingobium phenoxybenzoativorans]|uniref:Uncharacterized protein n=1 Tax=Sphingobium phenoxybenzoativorans TaxID=1592790 RepID=A0A975K5T4_9SPHN|nr:hypothetical protein [Sphingobium phenoxybenzoativorans]QUT04027.1 hypothetical protein KFK14_12810 [Sphingobium phenoxybenzoativorans]
MPDTHDPETGEIIEQVAADGGQRYPAAHSLADFIRMQEDGQFDADVAFDLNELAADLEELAEASGQGKLKATLNIKIEIARDPAGFYVFAASHTIKRPTEKRKQSVGWVTEDNKFTPNKPRQGNLFGTVRDVTPRREVRN